MSEKAIRVAGLGKEYQLGARERGHTTFREALSGALWAPFRRLRQLSGAPEPDGSFWALRDVSFDVEPGEVVGIIGRNGAGKSTLLKVLSQITEPTTGEIELTGRVASLLEVGTGFHQELTGRENIYLNGAILGMSRVEIKRKFDEIVAFAEVEKFLDTPVKRYSSGMYVRLAFAIAAHLEPEILIVDEVLAVGDAEFQKKCLGKMGEVARGGRTVLFVSHNMALVNTLCRSCVYLFGGELAYRGPSAAAVALYLNRAQAAEEESGALPFEDADLSVVEFAPVGADGVPRTTFATSEPVHLGVGYTIHTPRSGLRVGIDVCEAQTGTTLFRTFDDDGGPRHREAGTYRAVCVIPPNLLKPGAYQIKLQIGIHNVRWITSERIVRRIALEHVGGVNATYGDTARPGLIMPMIDWIQPLRDPLR
jgi:lipopolysaccharide transport system ATP-binding protein